MEFITRRHLRKWPLPSPISHKGENGRILVVAGSDKYHGSLLYAMKTAARIVDVVYFHTTAGNSRVAEKYMGKTAGFIYVDKPNFAEYDAILFGSGMEVSARSKRLLAAAFKSGRPLILDAAALHLLGQDRKLRDLLHHKCVLTPHAGEFRAAFGIATTLENVRRASRQFRCVILFKGLVVGESRQDVVVTPSGEISTNRLGNAGLTKGGTGDILAALVASFAAKMSPTDSAAAASYLLHAAADVLYKKAGPMYSAEDVVDQLPLTFRRLTLRGNMRRGREGSLAGTR